MRWRWTSRLTPEKSLVGVHVVVISLGEKSEEFIHGGGIQLRLRGGALAWDVRWGTEPGGALACDVRWGTEPGGALAWDVRWSTEPGGTLPGVR